MAINIWSSDTVWQSFSSMYREAMTAGEVRTDVEKLHHLTQMLYFAVSTLEAFLNSELKSHRANRQPEAEIIAEIRSRKFKSKLTRWSEEILGKPHPMTAAHLDFIRAFYDLRGELTHPKLPTPEIYARLERFEPTAVIDAVAEYIARFNEARGTRYPYWLFGWNYLNPRPGEYEIMIVNDQQFSFSLVALGFQVPSSDYGRAEAWRNHYMGAYEGYGAIKEQLIKLDRCEPKFDRFPYQPKLCRRWWTSEHHQSCGNVTAEALRRAR